MAGAPITAYINKVAVPLLYLISAKVSHSYGKKNDFPGYNL